MKNPHIIVKQDQSGQHCVCTACGQTYQIGLPAPAFMYLAILAAFEDFHSECHEGVERDISDLLEVR